MPKPAPVIGQHSEYHPDGDDFELKRAKLAATLARQTAEGWFPEVGGMDLGYCSVLLDYVMLYCRVTGDRSPLPAMGRLVRFMLPHIHPDMTVAAEAGLCQIGRAHV